MSEPMLAYHLDMKRAMWQRQYAERFADQLRAWGFNAIVYELEDKMRFRRHPDIAHCTAWSRQETADFVDSCRAKGMEVIPLVQSLGHAEYVVAKPQYAHLRPQPEVTTEYDPLSTEARDLLLELFDDVLEVFRPERFFHMGGDETRKLGQGEKFRQIVAEIGIGGLYLRHMTPLFDFLRGRGVRPIIWSDIVLAHAEVLERIPRDVVLMDWDYTRAGERTDRIRIWGQNRLLTLAEAQALPDSPAKALALRYAIDQQTAQDGTIRAFYYVDALRACGFDVITASATRCAGDMAGTPDSVRHWPNCFDSARKGLADGIGTLVTSWAVRHNHPDLGLAGAFAAAQAAHRSAKFDFEAIGAAFARDRYAAEMPSFAEAARKASASFKFGQAAVLASAAANLKRGKDDLAAYVESVDASPEGRAGTMKAIHNARAGYLEAREAFAKMKSAATRNEADFDLWIEGLDLNVYYADFVLAALTGELGHQAQSLLRRLEDLRSNTRRLFARTYVPESVEEEIALRYGFHEAYLQSALKVPGA